MKPKGVAQSVYVLYAGAKKNKKVARMLEKIRAKLLK